MKKKIFTLLLVGMILFTIPAWAAAAGSDELRDKLRITDEAKIQFQDRLRSQVQDQLYFQDIQQHWAREQIRSAYSWGLVIGYPDGNFNPDGKVTGPEAVTMMNRLLQCIAGIDAGAGTANQSQVSGEQQLNRLQFAVTLAKGLGIEQAAVPEDTIVFQDQTGITTADLGYILALKNLGLVAGDNGNFYPSRLVTRAEAAVMLTRVLNVLDTVPAECQTDADKLIITLQENPTTGYSWNVKMDKDGILKLESDEYKSNDTSGNIAGAGGEHVWVFKGLSKGDVVITFSYYRPWEDVNTAVETKTFTVNVGKDGKIERVR